MSKILTDNIIPNLKEKSFPNSSNVQILAFTPSTVFNLFRNASYRYGNIAIVSIIGTIETPQKFSGSSQINLGKFDVRPVITTDFAITQNANTYNVISRAGIGIDSQALYIVPQKSDITLPQCDICISGVFIIDEQS